jgi:hypothetical protein
MMDGEDGIQLRFGLSGNFLAASSRDWRCSRSASASNRARRRAANSSYSVSAWASALALLTLPLSPRTFPANYPEFPDSCLRFDLPFLVNVLEMLVDGPNILLEQLCDECLAQPKRFADKTALDSRAAVFRLVQDDLASLGCGFIGRGRLVLGHPEALYRRSARRRRSPASPAGPVSKNTCVGRGERAFRLAMLRNWGLVRRMLS